MRRLRGWWVRLVGTFGAGRRDRDISEELEMHLEMLKAEHRRKGADEAEARRAAGAEFGSVAAAVGAYRDQRGMPSLENWMRDVAYAVRSLGRSPLLAASMVLVLGLGIGLGTAILMVLHSIVWRDLPVPHADGVVKLSLAFQGTFSRRVLGHPSRFSYPEIAAYRESARALEAMAGFRDERIMWRQAGDARPLSAMLVTGDYFSALRVSPAAGRLLSGADAHAPAVVISERLWRDAFNASPDILGATMVLDRRPCTVVGVVAAPFIGTEMAPADIWLPLESRTESRGSAGLLSEANTGWLMGVGRLRSGASVESARAEASVIGARFDGAYPGRRTIITVTRASALDAGMLGQSERGKLLGAGASVGLVVAILLLTCGSNVGGLLLARGATRYKEFALRIALGAGRARIAQQLVAEIGVITLAGAAVGVVVCWWTLRLFGRLPPLASIVQSIALDWRMFGIAALSALVIAFLFGIAPARQALRVDCLEGLKGEASGVGSRVLAARLRGGLVSMQVAISLVLLVAAALVGRSIERTFDLDPGYATAGLFAVTLDMVPGAPGAPDLRAHRVQQMAETLEATPGIRGAGFVMVAPFHGVGSSSASTDRMSAPVPVHFNRVDAAYFRTLGVPIVAGRSFVGRESEVVLINAALASSFWGDERSAVGRTMTIPSRGGDAPGRIVEVVGVIPTLQTEDLGGPDAPAYYELLAQNEREGAFLVVRADPGVPVPRMAVDAARALDRDAFVRATSIEQRIAGRTVVARMAGTAAASIGLLALLVAAVGIHGIVAHAVTCRTRDIGVYLALGASRAGVLRLVLGQTLRGVALGALGGGLVVTVVGLSFSRPFRAALFGVSPLDPIACLAALAVLATVILAAAYLPARRAVSVSPVAALRQE